MTLLRSSLWLFSIVLPCLPLSAADTTVTAPPSPSETAAEQTLRELMIQQKDLFAMAKKEDPKFDQDNFQSQLQQLCNEYDRYLNNHPDSGTAYFAYATLLGKVGMRHESAALLLKANQLDKSNPVIKNQLGNFAAEEGKPLEAVNYYLAAIELAPQEPLYHYQLGSLLTEARDDFLTSGQWTRAALDKSMHGAFKKAMELAPDKIAYAYRYGESFYDLDKPNWDEALEFWHSLERQVAAGLEKQTIQLHEANVLIKQQKIREAQDLIAAINEKSLEGQKQKLIALLSPPETK